MEAGGATQLPLDFFSQFYAVLWSISRFAPLSRAFWLHQAWRRKSKQPSGEFSERSSGLSPPSSVFRILLPGQATNPIRLPMTSIQPGNDCLIQWQSWLNWFLCTRNAFSSFTTSANAAKMAGPRGPQMPELWIQCHDRLAFSQVFWLPQSLEMSMGHEFAETEVLCWNVCPLRGSTSGGLRERSSGTANFARSCREEISHASRCEFYYHVSILHWCRPDDTLDDFSIEMRRL